MPAYGGKQPENGPHKSTRRLGEAIIMAIKSDGCRRRAVNAISVAAVVFVCAFGGTLVGMFLQRVLPPPHLRQESRDVIRLGTGLIATMAALVLGLLVGTAKSSFDAQTSGFRQLATNIILLDGALEVYGPDAQKSRELLRRLVASTIDRLWPPDGSPHSKLADSEITTNGRAFLAAVRDLAPSNDAQRAAQTQALQTAAELARTRWNLSQQDEVSLPMPFLVVLAFWLFVLFSSFGLFSPKNVTVITVFLVCALSVAGAVFLIVDLDQPFDGLLQVSSASLRNALALLEQGSGR